MCVMKEINIKVCQIKHLTILIFRSLYCGSKNNVSKPYHRQQYLYMEMNQHLTFLFEYYDTQTYSNNLQK